MKGKPKQRKPVRVAMAWSGMGSHRPWRSRGGRALLRRVAGLAAASSALGTDGVGAESQGMTVISGQASAVHHGARLDVIASHNAVLGWETFNVARGEQVNFVQPSAGSVVWNHIGGGSPSDIRGQVHANGVLVLINPSGFYFGPESVVSAAGAIVSTAPPAPLESSAGLFWQFNGVPPSASIVNHGQIHVGPGGSAFLISNRIENHGEIRAPGGAIGLFGGGEVLVSERPDGRGLSAQVALPEGSVENTGRLVADAGTIALHARVVNQGGLIQANTVREKDGVIELVAGDTVELGPGSHLSARGPEDGAGDGGRIEVISKRRFEDSPGSRVEIQGGGLGGDGGFVELSAPELGRIQTSVDGRSTDGGKGGELLIDPTDILISNGGGGVVGNGTVSAGDPPSTLSLDVNSAFVGLSRIELQATRNISLASGTVWDLSASTGLSDGGGELVLAAGNNITIGNGAALVGGDQWSVHLRAGADFSSADGVTAGTGSVLLTGTGSIETRDGSIRVRAGNGVTVAGGFIRTVGGGDIDVEALAGNVNTGTRINGFLFRPGGYAVDPELGGISTAAGGDVRIRAGQDVLSYLPVPGGVQTDGGSGAFGAGPGNVSIEAGRDVAGHYVVRNGEGRIVAGRNAGAPSRLLALSLVSGGWDVRAGQDILLQEVRNPNGIFNNLGSGNAASKHLFDYAASAYVTLEAASSVQLRGTSLPRYNDTFEQGITPIYPGTLRVVAGAGGVVLGNDVTLFPSPSGNLEIVTTAGGGVSGSKPGELVQLVVSDSSKVRYREFGDFGIADHAAVPVHLGDSVPVRLDVAGDLVGVVLGVPKLASIRVGGDMINSRFDGQNLRATDVTSIHVAGDIVNRNEFTTVPVEEAPNLAVFDLVYPPLPGELSGLASQLVYNPGTRMVTFQGRMTGDQLQALLALPVREFDANGLPVLLPNGEPATRSVSVLPVEVANRLYAESQDVPLNPDTGYRIGGGGLFEMSARNMDLGATVGIVSQGPRANTALARLLDSGADLDVRLRGGLTLFSTQISTLQGGDISIEAGGDINVGSRTYVPTGQAARGIFTTDRSDVTVIARGNVNVNGSRIAAYDGGNVTVRSLEGNIDAGTGGSGAATVEKLAVDPLTRQVLSYSPTIPGSGILATTFPPSLDPAFPSSRNRVGNILVETPRGNIVASSGGVVQIPLNGIGSEAGTVTLVAGTRDQAGGVVHPGNIDASGSGVIGSTVRLQASGSISGLVFAREDAEVAAVQNVNVTALAQGNVNVSSGGTVSGTIIGVGGVSASGATVDAALLSQNVSASGNVTSGDVGFGQGTAAAATSQAAQAEEPARAVASAAGSSAEAKDAEEEKRKAKPIALVRRVGRVTVILPGAESSR